MSQPYTPTPRTRLVREADRAVYDREAAYRILDEGFLCHVGILLGRNPDARRENFATAFRVSYLHVRTSDQSAARTAGI
jgi:hypothetical protein